MIRRKLTSLKRLFRFSVALDGLMSLVFALILLLACDFALDRFFEFSRFVRTILLGAITLAAVFFGTKRLLCPLIVKIRDDQWAMLLERFFPALNGTLLTAVELESPNRSEKNLPQYCSATENDTEESYNILLVRAANQATQILSGANMRHCFRIRRLLGRLGLVFLLLLGCLIFCVTFATSAEIWFSRNILLSEREWPRRSLLLVDGLEDGKIRVVRGDSLTLTVRASETMPLVPDRIRLLVGTSDTKQNTKTENRTVVIDQFRAELRDGTTWRIFTYTFHDVLEDLSLTVRGGDCTLPDLQIVVVPPPVLYDFSLQQQFPAYMKRIDRSIVPSASTFVPDGTTVTLSARANKALKRVSMSLNQCPPLELENISNENAVSEIATPAITLREDTLVEFFLEDEEGQKNRQPLRLGLFVVKDAIPTVEVRLHGIGTAITPSAVLPLRGDLSDDQGLSEIFYRYDIASKQADTEKDSETTLPPQNRTGEISVQKLTEMQTRFSLNEVFAVQDIQPQPGDLLQFSVCATDYFDLDTPSTTAMVEGESTPPEHSRIASSAPFVLNVVSEKELLSLLELQEISLRQRFEVLLDEIKRTEALALEIDFHLSEPNQVALDALVSPMKTEEETAEEFLKRNEIYEAERFLLQEILDETQIRDAKYNTSRLRRDLQKEMFDLRAIVGSFHGICEEMANNRIFTAENDDRLNRGIIRPLEAVLAADFPQMDSQLTHLEALLDQQKTNSKPEPQRTLSLQAKTLLETQIRELVQKLEAIRDQMAFMESYSEALEMLRNLIHDQQRLRNETVEQKNARLRSLIEN